MSDMIAISDSELRLLGRALEQQQQHLLHVHGLTVAERRVILEALESYRWPLSEREKDLRASLIDQFIDDIETLS